MRSFIILAFASHFAIFAELAFAADAHLLDGAKLSAVWGIPFIGLLLSIAIFPLTARDFWHHHHGKVVAFWTFALLLPLAFAQGPQVTGGAVAHTVLLEYIPFTIFLFALYTVAGGILVTGNLRGTPATNTAILAFGAAIASLVGTTGASIILIRPILRANEKRKYRVHVVVFFIFLVSNIGGALTPLGDPPLFIGYLRGVDFFWTTRTLLGETLLASAILLGLFFALDTWLQKKERKTKVPHSTKPIRVQGEVNFLLLMAIMVVILISASWKPNIVIPVFGTPIELQNLVRDIALVDLALLSLWLTGKKHRTMNGFSWEPIKEVAKLFAGIFVAIIPVLAMLQAGVNGPFAWLLELVTRQDGNPHQNAYFWLTGGLSAFLDNAPTYLLFFELAGGNAQQLMGPLAPTLMAISSGAVFMGALTYIGNAPNFMVKAIAEERGVQMPSFFGFIGWSAPILLPLFILLKFISININ